MLLLINTVNFFRRERKNDILEILIPEFREHINHLQGIIRYFIILIIIYIEESSTCFHGFERLFRMF